MTHICIGKLTSIDSDNGLSPGRHQAIIRTSVGICIVNWTLRNEIQWNVNRNSNTFIEENTFENVVCEVLFISSRLQITNHRIHMDTTPWWRHQMETFSALLAICVGNSPVPGEFPAQRPVAQSFDVFFHLCLNKRLSKQSWGWWFETLSHPLWRQCNAVWVNSIEPNQNETRQNTNRVDNTWCVLYSAVVNGVYSRQPQVSVCRN